MIPALAAAGEPSVQRKIIHCDADCFFASIEMRDNPQWRDRPLAVGGDPGRRGVISAANYEARKFGVRSAMASAWAKRLCPDLLIVPHNMDKYVSASRAIRAIFIDYTDRVEPLSLDEAFLDVSECRRLQGSATLIAEEIRQRVVDSLGITVSAGVAPNKFLAKVASDWNKPDGLFVVTPDAVERFVRNLPVQRLHGVGKVTAQKMQRLGIATCADLRRIGLSELTREFGSFGLRLHQLSCGIDDREVENNWRRKSLSVEETYTRDLPDLEHCLAELPSLFIKLKSRLSRVGEDFRVVKEFIKIKFDDFSTTTIEHSGDAQALDGFRELCSTGYDRGQRPVRLLGMGARFIDQGEVEARQLPLFKGRQS